MNLCRLLPSSTMMAAMMSAAVVATTIVTTAMVTAAMMTSTIDRYHCHGSNWYDSHRSNWDYLYNADRFVKTAVLNWS